MNRIKQIIISLALLGGVTALIAPADSALAINVFQNCSGGSSISDTEVCKASDDKASDAIKKVISTLLMVLGIMAVIVIIIAGFMYVTANGEGGRVKAAKDTILYAVIGLIVAMLAYAIVNFVVGKF